MADDTVFSFMQHPQLAGQVFRGFVIVPASTVWIAETAAKYSELPKADCLFAAQKLPFMDVMMGIRFAPPS